MTIDSWNFVVQVPFLMSEKTIRHFLVCYSQFLFMAESLIFGAPTSPRSPSSFYLKYNFQRLFSLAGASVAFLPPVVCTTLLVSIGFLVHLWSPKSQTLIIIILRWDKSAMLTIILLIWTARYPSIWRWVKNLQMYCLFLGWSAC